jgi:hypothetical protein
MISVFGVTSACERDLTSVPRAIFRCLIISDDPVCVLGLAFACPDKTDRAAPVSRQVCRSCLEHSAAGALSWFAKANSCQVIVGPRNLNNMVPLCE